MKGPDWKQMASGHSVAGRIRRGAVVLPSAIRAEMSPTPCRQIGSSATTGADGRTQRHQHRGRWAAPAEAIADIARAGARPQWLSGATGLAWESSPMVR
jgi:hypothetical protein